MVSVNKQTMNNVMMVIILLLMDVVPIATYRQISIVHQLKVKYQYVVKSDVAMVSSKII